jgi:hypothetical protein
MIVNLTESAWTIGSYLRSAATKFEEIERDCLKPESAPAYRSLAPTFANQKTEALRLAELFEQAESVELKSDYTDDLCDVEYCYGAVNNRCDRKKGHEGPHR